MSKENFGFSEVDVTQETGEEQDNEQQQRITFQSPSDDVRPKSRTGRRRQRSRSRDSRTSSLRRSRSITGVPIEFRTLSIQVADSQHVSQDIVSLKEDSSSTLQNDSDLNYFKNLRYHLLGTDEVCQQLSVSYAEGLSVSAASRRLQRDGTNTIPQRRESYLRKTLGYVFGGFCSVLWIGVIIFFLCWRPLSNPPSIPNLALAILVLIVIFLQASFSAFQDWSTKRVMNSILDLLPSETLVLREGSLQKIPASQLVAGDIVNISIGNKVPADLRLLETSGDIRFDRSVLTGEADEIEGAIDSTDDNFLETRNIALMGTNVTNGNGVGVVVLTGGRTVMGRIAKDTYGVKDKPTLIQQEISRFVRIIVCLTIVLASLILFTWVGWIRVDHPKFMNVVQMLNDVMGCVVAFIPEGKLLSLALFGC
jgi:sodium/potassium-transporting ATPase subunit alpha